MIDIINKIKLEDVRKTYKQDNKIKEYNSQFRKFKYFTINPFHNFKSESFNLFKEELAKRNLREADNRLNFFKYIENLLYKNRI